MLTPFHFVVVALFMFFIGVVGVLVRKNIFIVLMSMELMLNSANLVLIAFSRLHADITGHIFVLFVIAIAAAEVSVGLALVIALYRHKEEINIEILRRLRG